MKVHLLRRQGMGNNCHHVADNFPGGMTLGDVNEMPKDTEWVVRWGTTTNLPFMAKVINKSPAIHETYDKGTFRAKCAEKDLAPKVWFSLQQFLDDPYDNFENAIVRPRNHQRSADLYYCTSLPETTAACKKLGEGNYYISEFIDKVQEYRAFIVSGRCICLLEKVPRRGHRNDVSWGFAEFVYINWSDWNLEVLRVATAAFDLTGLDFAALDLVVDRDGKAWFLEANTAPEVWKYYGSKLALALEHTINNDRKRMTIGDPNNWKGYIHPVVSKKAIL